METVDFNGRGNNGSRGDIQRVERGEQRRQGQQRRQQTGRRRSLQDHERRLSSAPSSPPHEQQQQVLFGRSPVTLISSFGQKLWVDFCGTDSYSVTVLNSILAVDLCLVIGAGGVCCGGLPQVFHSLNNGGDADDGHNKSPLSPQPNIMKDILEFSLLYFSLINGWFLYIHHYQARFSEVSRANCILSWMFILSMFYAVTHASMTNVYFGSDDDDAINIVDITNRSKHGLEWNSISKWMISSVNKTADHDYFDTAHTSTSHHTPIPSQVHAGHSHSPSSTTAMSPLSSVTYMYNYRHFSIAMIYMRLAVFMLLARVACYVDRAQPFAALLAVFIGDAILCFSLSAASDFDSATILWTFVAITELNVDFFLAVGLRGPIQIPYRVDVTMQRVYALILAPMGGIVIQMFLKTSSTRNSSKPQQHMIPSLPLQTLFGFASLILLMMFGMIFSALHEGVLESMDLAGRSEVQKALLIVLLKVLGYTIWLAGACAIMLLEMYDGQSPSRLTAVMCNSVGATLICFIVLRRFSNRPINWIEVLWWIMTFAPWTLLYCIHDKEPISAIFGLVVIVSILNIAQAWDVLGTLDMFLVSSLNIHSDNNGSSGNSNGETTERSIFEEEPESRMIPSNNDTGTLRGGQLEQLVGDNSFGNHDAEQMSLIPICATETRESINYSAI